MARKVRVLVADLQAGRCRLSPEEAHYVTRVHRLRVGDPLLLVDPERALEADAQVLTTGAEVIAEVGKPRPGERRGLPLLELVWGIGKGDKLDEVIRTAVVLGAGRLSIVETGRSVPRLKQASAHKRDRWQLLAHDALRQCERADALQLHGPEHWEQALAAEDDVVRIVLQPDAQARPLQQQLAASWSDKSKQRVQLWVGPEGGFEPLEIERLSAAGAVLADLGPLVLRTETAACVALALASAFMRDA